MLFYCELQFLIVVEHSNFQKRAVVIDFQVGTSPLSIIDCIFNLPNWSTKTLYQYYQVEESHILFLSEPSRVASNGEVTNIDNCACNRFQVDNKLALLVNP